MPLKLYKYGNDKLLMKVLKNLHEVIDFVNPNNENLQSTVQLQSKVQFDKGLFQVHEKVLYFLEQSQIKINGNL